MPCFLLSRSIPVPGIRIHEPGLGIRIPRTQFITVGFPKLWNQLFLVVFNESGSGFSISAEYLPTRIQGVDEQNLKEIETAEKDFILFLIKNCNLLIPTPLQYKGRQSYRRSLQHWKENIQYFKTWNFLIFFYFCACLPLWIRVHWPDWIPIRNTGFFRWADPADSGPDVFWEVYGAHPPAETLRSGAVQGSHRQICQGE
jgi:hypothetical protein